jgi:6-pyruvoyltetrahydropterin/6-carboxytetrahydropterin synthase
MFEVSVAGHFAASHMLRGYEGKCKNLHGHTWKVEVALAGNKLNDTGMLIDFVDVKKKLNGFLETLDHVHLNDLPVFQDINPTTENIAKHVFEKFSEICRPLELKRVRVWESDASSVTYYSDK